ncbi:Organic solute transporter alpha-like protein 3 [Parelaphostrongylus tenuis]|uniref:Organic solute transporter alpha-like protein 3 n=1 Tax=Parelaphostrongylus tenuis TaxID=148309 RepID=A0AAD5M9T9_PARTN|nr:Organic solute transporter alpha-like protein 3 [Parelaphostrongylus tenuis]
MEYTSEAPSVVEQIDSIMRPSDTNCSGRSGAPSAKEFLTNLERFQVVLLTIAGVFALTVFGLAFVHWYHVYSFVSIETRRNKLYWLITLFPVSTVCCLIGMIAPRTSLIMTSLGILYYLMCLFVIVSLCRHLFGGRKSFSKSLRFDSRLINFQSPPFCCVMPCLPTAQSSERNIRRLEWLVLQAPVIRALIMVCDIIAVAEMRESAKAFLRYSNIFAVGSLLLAIFGVHTLARVTSNKLSDYCFMTIFRFVDVSLLFFTSQEPIIFQNILRLDLIKCGRLLSAQENASFMCNFVIICEMSILSVLATILLTPRRNAMFDNCGASETSPPLHGIEESDTVDNNNLQSRIRE